MNGERPELDMTTVVYIILTLGVVVKGVLWLYCSECNKTLNSDSLNALAEDHLNDVLSNAAALITLMIAYHFNSVAVCFSLALMSNVAYHIVSYWLIIL